MVKVAKGESGLKQWYDNGKVVRGRIVPQDTGLFQINSTHWAREAKMLGLDYENSLVDNVKMARHIYDTQGIHAWVYYNTVLAQGV